MARAVEEEEEKDRGRWNRQWEEGGRRPWRVINGRMVVGRLRHTRREQSDSNKVNLPPIHLPQPISRLTGRALHTLTNATLAHGTDGSATHHFCFCYLLPPKWKHAFSRPPIFGSVRLSRGSIIHQRRWLSERSTLPHRFLWPLNHAVYQTHLA